MSITLELKQSRPKFASLRTREMYYAAKSAMQSAANTYRTRTKCAQAARQEMLKTADFGTNQNPAFEKAFGSIAFTYLEEKVPGLVPSIMGFQLLDRDENGRKAIGVFVAQIGERIIDIPMFFINGELKGHQLMRLRQPDLFLPLREAFIDYLMSKLPQDLGESGAPISESNPLRSTPEMSPFNASRLLKNSEDLDHIHDWALDAQVPEAYASMRSNKLSLELGVSLLEKKGSVRVVDLPKLIATEESLLKTAARLADQYPIFRIRMDARFGEGWLQKSAVSFKQAQDRKLQLRRPAPEYGLKLASQGINSPAPELEFRKHPNLRKSAVQLDKTASEDLLEELRRFGEQAIDRRQLDKLSKAYKVESSSFKLEPPDTPGEYDVFKSDGTKVKAVVIPGQFRKPHARHDLVIDMKNGLVSMAQRNSYICRSEAGQATKDPNVATVLKAKKKRPKAGDFFVLVDDTGMVAGPFLCREKVDKSLYMINDYRTHSAWETADDDNIPEGSISGFDASEPVDELVYDEKLENATVRKHKGHIYAGKNAMCAVLIKGMDPLFEEDFEEGYVPYSYFKKTRLDLMYPSSVGFADLDKFANLEVRKRAAEQVEVNGKRMSKEEARKLLMVSLSLGKEAAHEALDCAEDVKRYIVFRPGVEPTLTNLTKQAAFPQPNTPPWPMEEQPYNSESGQYMIQEPQMEMTESAPMPRKEPIRPWEDPHDGMFAGEGGGGVAPEEMGTSPEELFDVMGLVSLVRNSRIDNSIKQTTRSLIQSIDHLGRMLFMFYTHNDEFEARYGENDMQDLESALISVFEGAGDLFITLNRRSNDPQPELDIMDLPVDM